MAGPGHDQPVMGLGKWAAGFRGQCMGAPHGCVLVVAKVAHWCGGKLALMAQPGMLLLLTMYGCPDVSSLLLPAACGS